MLLRHRSPSIDPSTVTHRAGFEHVEPSAIAVLRWLNAHKVGYVVVGPVGHAIRGDLTAKGPVAIVPAPYGRNYDRLAQALIAEHAGLRSERGLSSPAARGEAVAVKLSGDKLARGRRWMVRVGEFDLDVERSATRGSGEIAPAGGELVPVDQRHAGQEAGARYQELLYEAHRFELMDGVTVEVASPEDLELYSHVRRTGSTPEFRVTRTAAADGGDAPADAETPSGQRSDP